MATTDSIDTVASRDTAAMDRAARRLQAWAGPRPEAALLARYAALAVRVDAPLLRRLRLQLLPRAEPGIEADVWFAGLHESLGRSGFVFDARVQQLLRAQLAAPVPAGARSPLEQAWQITAGLHADWPEALRTEEALTYHALRDGPDAAAQVDALLAPALKAMAGGGETRALEVARWAQRAVPRLPDAARRHPAALALWLASLLRLGLSADQLPDTGAGGLPPALRWLLPAGQLAAQQRLAITAFDDALQLQPLADGAPPAASEITLPSTTPLLLALQADWSAGRAPSRSQVTLAVDATASETRVGMTAGWTSLTLSSLTGQRWQLQRQAGEAVVDEPPLPWQRMRVVVLGDAGPAGMGFFVSPTEVVTVVDVLPPALVQALRTGTDPAPPAGRVRLHAWDADGDRQELSARLVALDLRSALALLVLQRPFPGVLVFNLGAPMPAAGSAAWTVPGLQADRGHWPGTVLEVDGPPQMPPGRAAPAATARHIGVQLPQAHAALVGIAGAPVFVRQSLVGIADLASVAGGHDAGSMLWVVPAPAIDRFLGWARRPVEDGPQLLLHHAVDDPYGKGAELDERAVQRIAQAADRARLRLVIGSSAGAAQSASSSPQGGVFTPGLAGAVRLVTPVTREGATRDARLDLLALAALRWARPDFGVLHLGFRQPHDRSQLPAPLAGAALQDIDKTEPEALARQLLDLTEPPDTLPPGPLRMASGALLEQQLGPLARPFQRSRGDLGRALAPARDQNLAGVADFVVGRWNISSRLDAVPVVELLAQLALPMPEFDPLEDLRVPGRSPRVLNALPAQLGRLLIARAHAGRVPPPCVVVRDQAWQGQRSADSIHAHVVAALAAALGCADGEARLLLERLGLVLAPWVLVTTRPLPDADTLQALRQRLPAARFLFLAGMQPDLPEAARAIGAHLLPPLPEGADMQWLAGYKRLMEWARPRKRPTRPARAATPPLKK
ncbi:MAG: hypothetical protein V4795_04550 [Pseudomonadota bacterium]